MMSRLVGLIAIMVLSGCAATHAEPASPGKVTAQLRSGSPELRGYQIDDWIAPDDRTLIVNSADRILYRARFRSSCPGLQLTDTLAFIVQSPPQLEKYLGVVLPDGRHCTFASIARVEVAPAAAQAH